MAPGIRPAELISIYYADNPIAWQILLDHSRRVTRRALKVCRHLQKNRPVDLQFVAEAAMLHDIGMIRTDTPELGCSGDLPYMLHGIAGREILEKEGFPKHALICERHIGVGLTAQEIRAQKLPLPERDMLPISIEEQIICYADLYYSKSKKNRDKEKTPAQVRKSLGRFGADKPAIYNHWLEQFEPELS